MAKKKMKNALTKTVSKPGSKKKKNTAYSNYDKQMKNNNKSYNTAMNKANKTYNKAIAGLTDPGEYTSEYQDRINTALDTVTNRKDFSYDPLQDVSYKALAKIYNQQGAQAARDTMGDAAALNGGYGSSYASTAAAQQRSAYNQQLASQIPTLREQAYNEYLNNYNMNVTALEALQNADTNAYGRYRDTMADYQWGQEFARTNYNDDRLFTYGKFNDNRNFYRDVYENNRDYKTANSQWTKQFNYNKSRDSAADKQWAAEYKLKKNSLSSSGSSKSSSSKKRSSRGSSSYSSSYSSGSSGSSGSSSGSVMSASDWAKTTPTRTHKKK